MCEKRQKISLAGIGMGAETSVTEETARAIRECDCLIGAERMLAAARKIRYGDSADENGKERRRVGADENGKERGAKTADELCEYSAEKISDYIEAHPQYEHIAVILSGDTGFYSGAKKLIERLNARPGKYQTEMLPGISSVAYLAARLGTTWEDAALVSLHGQEENFIQTVHRNNKTFLLLGGKGTLPRILEKLSAYGMDDVTVYIGSDLSYPEERIVSGHPGEIKPSDAAALCAAMIVNPAPDTRASAHIEDEEFIRGNTPMTKSEVRAVSIARLGLTENAVVYDVGAGTGSVSIEAARCSDRIRVYAVEKKEDAVRLLEQNRKKFRTDGVHVIHGEAPAALESLEAPTHVFIGGSSGNLSEIIKTVRQKNPSVRIVVNAISLETVKAVMDAEESGLLPDAQITQIMAARSRLLGGYHMMTGQNPVYIISAGGTPCWEQDAGGNVGTGQAGQEQERGAVL